MLRDRHKKITCRALVCICLNTFLSLYCRRISHNAKFFNDTRTASRVPFLLLTLDKYRIKFRCSSYTHVKAQTRAYSWTKRVIETHAIGAITKKHVMMKCYAINVDTNVASVLCCEIELSDSFLGSPAILCVVFVLFLAVRTRVHQPREKLIDRTIRRGTLVCVCICSVTQR